MGIPMTGRVVCAASTPARCCLLYTSQQGNTISSTSSNEQVNQTLEYRLLEDLNAAMGSSYALSDHQILIYHGKDFPEGSTLKIDGSDFTVVTLPESDSVNAYLRQTDAPTQPILFFQDQEDLIRAIQNDPIATVSYTLWFDYDPKSVNADLFPQALTEHLRQTEGAYGSQFKSEARTDFYRVYGSLLFVGLFFVALFLITTVPVSYTHLDVYKRQAHIHALSVQWGHPAGQPSVPKRSRPL